MNIEKTYLDLVEFKCLANGWDLSYHVKDVMKSVLMTRDKVWQGGGGVQSILSNDLRQAINYCDSEIVKHLKELVIARDNFFIK
jgi:hypothetical protein